MGPRCRLTLLGTALALCLSAAMPVSAGDRNGTKPGPAVEQSVPGTKSQGQRLKDAPEPADEPEAPVPGGCPLREGKLELIA